MRNTFLAIAFSVAVSATANAGDIYRAPDGASYKDAPVYAPLWNGFYAGANGGYGWEDNQQTLTVNNYTADGVFLLTDKFDAPQAEGGFGGGQIGYNWQGIWNPNLVLGVEADIQGAGIGGTRTSTVFTGLATNTVQEEKNLDWFGTVRGRLGYAANSTLFYVTGGFAYGGVKDSFKFTNIGNGNVALASKSSTLGGYVVGAGLEYKFTPQWSFKAEYQYISLGDTDQTGTYATGGQTENVNGVRHDYNTVRAGVNYSFASGYAPLK